MQKFSQDGDPIIVRREKQSRSTQGQSPNASARTTKHSSPQSEGRPQRDPAQRTRKPVQEQSSEPAPNPHDHKRRRQIVGLTLAVLGVILMIALLSYSRMDDANASLSLREFIGLFRGDEAVRLKAESVHNLLGIFGAVLAHFFFNNTIGFSALLLPILLFVWSKHLYKDTLHDRLYVASMLALALGIATAAVMGTIQKISWMPELGPEWSGAVGQFLASIFTQLLGKVGALVVFFTAMIVALILGIDLALEKSLLRLQLEIAKLRDRWDNRTKTHIHSSAHDDHDDAPYDEDVQTPSVPITQQPKTQERTTTERAIEPARIIRRNAEKQGTAGDLDDIVQKYEQAPHRMQTTPQGQVPVVDSPPPIQQAAIAIQRPIQEPNRQEFNKQEPTTFVQNDQSSHISKEQSDIRAKSVESDAHAIDDPIVPTSLTRAKETHGSTHEQKTQSPSQQASNARPLTLTVQEQEEEEKSNDRVLLNTVPAIEEIHYVPPTIDLLIEEDETNAVDDEELKHNAQALQEKLRTFKIEIEDVQVTPGPVVTQYEFVPAAGIKVSQIENLSDDIALALKARGIRIIAPVPGRGTVAVEIPNH